MKKLTMISVTANGKRVTKFVQLPVQVNGRVVAPMSLVEQMLSSIGCKDRGQTFTVG